MALEEPLAFSSGWRGQSDQQWMLMILSQGLPEGGGLIRAVQRETEALSTEGQGPRRPGE